MFYPIFVNKEGDKVLRVGDSMPVEMKRENIMVEENEIAIFPINTKGEEAIWHLSQESFLKAYEKGFVKLGKFNTNGMSISYLSSGMQKKIEDGTLPVVGRNKDGSVIFSIEDYNPVFLPGTQWRIKSHDATEHGTKLLQNFIGQRFSYPKSLYSVRDAISFFVSQKKNALIIDFFAGSGTTMPAINLLNSEDGGNRRCILVTNNEVSDEEARALSSKGYKPGDENWEKFGIAQYVTWPRIVCAIKGQDISENPLSGNYLRSDMPLADGFETNATFFKLGFLDKTAVALGLQFKELLPVLWMKAGAFGPCPSIEEDYLPEMLILSKNKFAVLIDENFFDDFAKELEKYPDIETAYIITDYDVNYKNMVSNLNVKTTYQLYRDYLDNFRINHGRD